MSSTEPLRVVHLNTVAGSGGAGVAVQRIHHSLVNAGVLSRLLVMHHHGSDEDVREYQLPPSHNSRAARLAHRWRRWRIAREQAPYVDTLAQGNFNTDRSNVHGGDLIQQLLPTDIIHLHWVAQFVDWTTFFSHLPPDVPVVWSLHDMNPFTGGCHYNQECPRYRNQCGKCPQLDSNRNKDLSRLVWNRKGAALNRLRTGQLTIAVHSEWFRQLAQSSSLFREFPIKLVPLGLDTNTFRPQDKQTCRAELGIDPDADVLLFVAVNTTTPRKGFEYLKDALEAVKNRKRLQLVSVGRKKISPVTSIPHHHLGYIKDASMMAKIYGAADVFIMPSLYETFGQVAAEALACKTPVVAFDSGGVREVVRHEQTGYLAPVRDTEALATYLDKLLGDPDLRQRFGENGYQLIHQQFTLAHMAAGYREVYESAIGALASR
jgi:glycosyltransferase involved in cell wall biosynthesis